MLREVVLALGLSSAAALRVTMNLGAKSTPEEVLARFGASRLEGRTAVITGATSGIGLETAKTLGKYGCRVVLCGRDARKTAAAANEVQGQRRAGREPPTVLTANLDLGDLKSVAAAAAAVKESVDAVDFLILNAGIMALPERQLTPQGFEKQLGTNHFGHFYFAELLRDNVAKAPDARVVTLSSSAHNFGTVDLDDLHYARRAYSAWPAYGQSKLANLLFARALQKRLGPQQRSVAVHPGVIRTGLWNQGNPANMAVNQVLSFFAANKDVAQGAATTVYACVAPNVGMGAYLQDCAESRSSTMGADPILAEDLWRVTEEQITAALTPTPAVRAT